MGTHPLARSPWARSARAGVAAVGVATAVVAVMAVAGSAGAAPAAPQATVGQVQARIKSLTSREAVLGQKYDVASEQYQQSSQRLLLINGEVVRDKASMGRMHTQIAEIASTFYEEGSMTSAAALLTSSHPQSILGQSAIMIHLSTVNSEALSQYVTLDRQLLGAQQSADRTKQSKAAQWRQLGSQKAHLNHLLDQQKALLATLTAPQQAQVVQSLGGGGATGGIHYTGPTGSQADAAVAFAYKQLGCPYVYGATGPCSSGFDCSGLTMKAWWAAGVSIPRDTYEQAAALPSVPRSDMQPGDILEFAGDSHVGIYVGGGYLIDAPQPGMTVEKVPLSESWYTDNLDQVLQP